MGKQVSVIWYSWCGIVQCLLGRFLLVRVYSLASVAESFGSVEIRHVTKSYTR